MHHAPFECILTNLQYQTKPDAVDPAQNGKNTLLRLSKKTFWKEFLSESSVLDRILGLPKACAQKCPNWVEQFGVQSEQSQDSWKLVSMFYDGFGLNFYDGLRLDQNMGSSCSQNLGHGQT